MKKVRVWGLIILLLLMASGCRQSTVGSAAAGKAQGNNLLAVGEITDPAALEKLWQEYIYDAIPTVGNTLEYHSAGEIDPSAVAQYCWFKYLAEHGPHNLKTVSGESTLLLFPLETALDYAKRYFNLDSVDVSKIPDYYYNPQQRGFTISDGRKDPVPSYTASNSWDMHLEKVTKEIDGTVNVILKYYGYRQRLETITTFTLKQREDGSLYFVSGRKEFVNNHLVALSGDLTRFDKIQGFKGNMQSLSMIGEINGKAILSYNSYDQKNRLFLMIMDPKTMTIEKEAELSNAYEFTHIKVADRKLVACLKDRVLVLNHALQNQEEIFLPQAVTGKMDRDPQYSKAMIPRVVFRGYDVSGDFSQMAYADETGVKLYSMKDNSEKMLSPTPPPLGPKEIDQSFHSAPRFVANDKKVISTMIVYEGINGYTLCDLEAGTENKIEIRAEEGSTGLIHYDTGLMAVNISVYDEKHGSGYKSKYLDFQSGKLMEIKLERTGDTGFIRYSDYGYVGRNQAAFITVKMDRSDSANNMYYLNRVNLKTLMVEQETISVKATSPHILGVLADGRIIFWYELNPSEKGICISEF
ncbi:MAG: hypothetical protein GX434_00355 [Peptococcaceae bacterium]|nr:hypothetical protein [Peptococcaceae bacterium]